MRRGWLLFWKSPQKACLVIADPLPEFEAHLSGVPIFWREAVFEVVPDGIYDVPLLLLRIFGGRDSVVLPHFCAEFWNSIFHFYL